MRIVFACALLALLNGCISYSGFPTIPSQPLLIQKRAQTLRYLIEGDALFAGASAVRGELTSQHANYAEISAVSSQGSGKGPFLKVTIKQLPPSAAAAVFGYLSYATLTVLPFWSLNDGSSLLFEFYQNGELVRSKEYLIQRRTFVWLAMLPFVWVNGLTPSEQQAFANVTRDFLSTI